MPFKKITQHCKSKEEETVVSNLEKPDLTSLGKTVDISTENEVNLLFVVVVFSSLFHVCHGEFLKIQNFFLLLWPYNLFGYYKIG